MLNEIDPLCILSFQIPGAPKAWARANRVGNRMVKSADQKQWASRIKSHFNLERMRNGSPYPITWPHDGPVYIRATGYFPLPKESRDWPDWRRVAALAGRVPCERVMDTDNMLKAVKDALNNDAYTDDRRVFAVRAEKKWALPEDARLKLEFWFYPEITESNYGI